MSLGGLGWRLSGLLTRLHLLRLGGVGFFELLRLLRVLLLDLLFLGVAGVALG
jgi:hypothetical protein